MYDYNNIDQRPPFGPFMPGGPFPPPFGPNPPGGQFPPPFGPMPPSGPFPPPFSPGEDMGNNARPYGPPPSMTPRKPQGAGPGVYRVDPGAIRPCRYQYVYIWLTSGRSFWAWLTFIGRNSVAGYRWNGFTWVYFGTDIDNIETFVCY